MMPAALGMMAATAAEAFQAKSEARRPAEVPALPAPGIGERLATHLRGHRVTLFFWTQQHKNDGIPDVIAAFSAAMDEINKLLDG
jgi:hypothetical protein